MAMKESDKKALGFLAVAAAGFGIYMYVVPMYDEHQVRLQQIDNLVQELKVAHRKAENMIGLAGEVDLLKYRLGELRKILPAEAGSFEIIEKMQDLAARSGIQIKGISVEDRKEKGEGWKTDGLRIQCGGYWFQFIEFLWRLENYERLIDITSITLSPEAVGPNTKLQRFSVEIVANIYSSTMTES